MLPSSVIEKLKKNLSFCFENSYDERRGSFIFATDKHKAFYSKNLGIKKIDSAFINYYSVVGFPPIGQGEELYTLNDILEAKEEEDEELPSEIGSRYLRFTSIEGEGSYYYDVETDAVYDVNWGEEQVMVSGDKEPWFTSFYDFLEWYYSD